jgi:hypothetical protein
MTLSSILNIRKMWQSFPLFKKLSNVEIEKRLLLSYRDSCITWRGAALRNGDHVLLRRNGDGNSIVGQLIDLKVAAAIPEGEGTVIARNGKNGLKRMALVRLYPFADETFLALSRGGELCHLPYSIREVSQSTMVEWIPVKSVVNICFIFHVDSIQKGLVSCGGMEHVFCVRFHNVCGKLSALKESKLKPFYRDPKYSLQESVPKSIYPV